MRTITVKWLLDQLGFTGPDVDENIRLALAELHQTLDPEGLVDGPAIPDLERYIRGLETYQNFGENNVGNQS